jgi:inner membrane protein
LAAPTISFWSRQYGVLVIYFGLVTMSHGFLDALTDGGLGIAFFVPFDATRYFFPWRPVAVSPIGINQFFSPWGLSVLLTEGIWIGIPVCLWLGMLKVVRRGG